MRLLAIALLLGLSPVPALAANAVFCPPLTWNADKTADPAPADIAALKCWAAARDPAAGYALALLTRAGRGVKADPEAARDMLKRLAEGTRQDQVGERISGRNQTFDMNIINWGTRTPDVRPYPPAMRELAKMQLLGLGGPRDVASAKRWLGKAAPQDREAALLLEGLAKAGY